MKILLIQPGMIKRPMDTDLKTRMSPPLSLLTLMSLTPQEHSVVMINENAERLDLTRDADFVGITVTLDVMPRAIQISAAFRDRGIPVAAGGIHISADPEAALPYFDAVCAGPAERVWARMIRDAGSGRLRGIYRDAENFSGAELISPAYSKIDNSKYLYTNVVTTSRGCPNRCDFCYNSAAGRMYVRRPIIDVVRDIEKLGTRHIFFIDDNFIGSPEYTRKLLLELRGMKLKWNAAVTTRILDEPELLDLMAETGCQSLFIGFESVNDESLHGVHKDNQAGAYESLADAIHSRGIMINASMVFGLDGDTPDVFRRTLGWLVKNRVETLTSHILTPYPGTALYARMDAAGRITERDLAKYNTAHVVFEPSGMTAQELYEGYLWIYKQFYSFRNILRRMPRSRSQWVPYLLFNFLYRKFGRFTSALARLVPMRLLGRLAEISAYRIK